MNYYIQGDAAKADQIKAAFEKLGYEKVNVILIGDYANERLFFFTENGKVRSTLKDCGIVHIIKTHPDYKELELPVEPKFKVGDWVVIDNCHNSVYQVDSVREYDYMLKHTHGGLMTFPFSSETRLSLWTIEDAKDGDVLACGDWLFILKQFNVKGNNHKAYCHYDLTLNRFKDDIDSYMVSGSDEYHPATEEQRDLLFTKMREAGYEWDAEKKELRKIQPHYDIANFKPYDKVLCRGHNRQAWRPSLYGFYDTAGKYPMFACATANYLQCIPFNDKTKHLLGTTDMPSEEYINW